MGLVGDEVSRRRVLHLLACDPVIVRSARIQFHAASQVIECPEDRAASVLLLTAIAGENGEMTRRSNPEKTEWEILGGAIRERRVARELTLVELAGLVDLSQPFLSQIENGRARPSMTSLYRIANALGSTPQGLFGGRVDALSSPALVRAKDARIVDFDADVKSSAHIFLAGEAPFHVLEYVGLPSEFGDYWEHEGFEAIYVVDGEIEVDIDGELSTLSEGDFLSYPSRIRHRLRSRNGEQARALLIETKFESLQDRRTGGHIPRTSTKRATKRAPSKPTGSNAN